MLEQLRDNTNITRRISLIGQYSQHEFSKSIFQYLLIQFEGDETLSLLNFNRRLFLFIFTKLNV